jgi:hypothetical protein
VFGLGDRQCWFGEVASDFSGLWRFDRVDAWQHKPFGKKSFEIRLSQNQEVGAIHELPLPLGSERIQKFCLYNQKQETDKHPLYGVYFRLEGS